jgi:hypothetical protein
VGVTENPPELNSAGISAGNFTHHFYNSLMTSIKEWWLGAELNRRFNSGHLKVTKPL